MVQRLRRTVRALVFAVGLVSANTASAGPLMDLFIPGADQSSSYPPIRYWAPAVARVGDTIHGPRLSVYPPDRHPEIPATYSILNYCYPAVEPAATFFEPPSPPPTSRFRY